MAAALLLNYAVYIRTDTAPLCHHAWRIKKMRMWFYV